VLSALQAKSQEAAEVSEVLRATLMRPEVLGDLYQQPGVLKEDCLYPAAEQVRPASLSVLRHGGSPAAIIPLSQRQSANLAGYIGALQRGAALPEDADAQALRAALAAAGALTDKEPAAAATADVTFAGHAMVRFCHRGKALLFDPWVLPTSSDGAYQPLTCSELEPDAIFITHSHPDHFDPGTLLRFGADVPIFVPRVQRESLLAIDMAYRLRELGFNRVHCMDWFEEVAVGDFRVRALPFYGEQPSVGAVYHPEVRNTGNAYLITAADRRYAVIADAGTDDRGSAVKVAAAARASHGPIDLLFGGFRSWAIYPLQYLFSSVARYLLFVPPEEWNVRHKIMNDADELIDTAEHWGAASVVPYAAGGAPWYWEFGMGPTHGAVPSQRHPFDPPPEHVLRAAAARSALRSRTLTSPAQVLMLRPGDSLRQSAGCWQKERPAPHAWPYPEDVDSRSESPPRRADSKLSEADRTKVLRKRILLRLWARHEVERLGAVVAQKDVQEYTDGFRRTYQLQRKEAMQAWLAESGLDVSRFSGLMSDLTKLSWLERHYGATIEEQLADERGLASAVDFAQRAVRS
jgi:L-ascorbate metabolism protein UlaG (beta-lactamase superfamily)